MYEPYAVTTTRSHQSTHFGKDVQYGFENDEEDEEVADAERQGEVEHGGEKGLIGAGHIGQDKVLDDQDQQGEGAERGEGLLEHVEWTDPVSAQW